MDTAEVVDADKEGPDGVREKDERDGLPVSLGYDVWELRRLNARYRSNAGRQGQEVAKLQKQLRAVSADLSEARQGLAEAQEQLRRSAEIISHLLQKVPDAESE